MKIQKFLALFFAVFFLQTNLSYSAATSWHENQSQGAKTRLIASSYQDKNGEKKLIAGLHFKIEKGWKIYGNGADNFGLPPSVEFTGSKNYSKHEIIWPEPKMAEEKIGQTSIKYFYYTDEIILPIEIAVNKNGEPTELKLKINFGLCKDVCIPANEDFDLKVSSEEDAEILQEIQKFYPNQISAKTSESEKAEKPRGIDQRIALMSAILLAIFGGAILNIMPCVLPVLSIKLMSVIKHSGAGISQIRFSFFSTILGILFCFIFFACVAGIITLTGNALGWGLQFQNTYFLTFLVVILTLFTGNLLGFFEINFDQFLATLLNKKITQSEEEENIFIPNFLSGILAVLLATPCSAPFLGSAISFALTQKFSITFIIFTAIGIGFALPYIILMIAPRLVYLLPKPGEWMIKIKQLMTLFLGATILWLLYVLSSDVGVMSAFLIGFFSLMLLFCFKIKTKFLKFLAYATVAAAIFSLPMANKKESSRVEQKPYNRVWKKFDEAELYKAVTQGKTVVVDITADWCLTCKFNNIRVFQDKEIMAKLKADNIVAMRGDITKPNEEIMNFLHKNGRFAIPFNAVFGPSAKNGLLASELLGKKELVELIDKAS